MKYIYVVLFPVYYFDSMNWHHHKIDWSSDICHYGFSLLQSIDGILSGKITGNIEQLIFTATQSMIEGLILILCPANERRCYFVRTFLIDWTQT